MNCLTHNRSAAEHVIYSVCTVRLFNKSNSHVHIQYISTLGRDKLPSLSPLSTCWVPVIAGNIRILNSGLGQCITALRSNSHAIIMSAAYCRHAKVQSAYAVYAVLHKYTYFVTVLYHAG
jgi:hypothetical protein